MDETYILSFQCPDRSGVVSRFSSLLYDHGAFITEISQYSDPETLRFFSRTVFQIADANNVMTAFNRALDELAADLHIEYTLKPVRRNPQVLLAVSKYDHCLNAILTKWRSGALAIDIAGVVSNHEDARSIVEFYELPFHYLPVTKQTKASQEAEIKQLMQSADIDLLVLARYMQILSQGFCEENYGRIINIHHSFLPGFKGARPYHQAHERGVKVIGATAHFVTPDLDEGPIIVQEVRPIDHRVTVQQMVQIGHDLEATALASAVKLFCEERVLLNGIRTVVL